MDQGRPEQSRPDLAPQPKPGLEQVGEARKEAFSAGRVGQIQKAWGRFDQGKQLTDEERATREALAQRGIGPMGGRAEPIPTGDITRIELLRVAQEINDEAERLGSVREFSPQYLQDQRGRVQSLIDSGVFTTDAALSEARSFIRNVNSMIDTAREWEGEELLAQREARVITRLSLERAEAERFDTESYQDAELRRIAEEVSAAIENRIAFPDFLSQRQREVTEAINRRPADGPFVPDAQRLLREIETMRTRLLEREAVWREEQIRLGSWSTYGELRMTNTQKRELIQYIIDGNDREIDRLFNGLFGTAGRRSNEDWNSAFGQSGLIMYAEFIGTINNAASGRMTFGLPIGDTQRERLTEKLGQLTTEYNLQEYLHNISYYVNAQFGTEEVAKAVGAFKAMQFDMAFRKPGVTEAYHFFEQAMFEVMARYGGYLPSKTMENKLDELGRPVYGEVEQLVRDHMEEAKKKGLLPNIEDWEVERAISLARGMGIVTARFFEVVAMGGLPPTISGARLVSWWANDIVSKIAFFKQVARYDIGKERNRFLAYRLEGGAPVWSIKELTELGDFIGQEMIFGMSESKDTGERYIDTVNPFRIGSVFTQTGWRYVEEGEVHASAIATLLDGYPLNPLIGAGMWIEKERGNLNDNSKLDGGPQVIFGQTVETKAQRATLIIRKNMALASEITPLKLFNNLPWFRLAMLKELYGQRPEYISAKAEEKNKVLNGMFTNDKQLQDDISQLVIVQEKLLMGRGERYREFLQSEEYQQYLREKGENPNVQPPLPPNLYEELTNFDFSIIADEGQRERVRNLAQRIHETLSQDVHSNRLMNNLKEKGWKVPFVFGADDIPFHLYSFIETGGTSVKRRWGDITSAAQAAGAYEQFIMNMGNFRNQDAIVQELFKIYNTLRGHDEGVTREVMFRTIEGVVKWFKKDWKARLPLGLGTAYGAITGKASAAQALMTREQMTMDETQSRDFLRKVRAAGLIDKEQEKKLRALTGSRALQVGYDIGRTIVPVIIAAIMFYMATKVTRERGLAFAA